MAVDKIIWKIILDFVVLACVAFPLLGLLLWAEPYHRGYFEDDMSLRLPYKQQTISEGLLAGLGFAIIIVTILATEITRDKQGKGVGEKFLSGSLIPGWIWESYTAIGIFTFGAACQQLTSNLAKYVIGRLRPHFYDVCLPQPNTSADNTPVYIQDYRCTKNSDAAILKDMRLSFPSAHSSFAMYCAIFFILYVQVKGKWRGSKLLRHGVQYAALVGAWYVGLSRVVEHMHHWSDVAAGFLIGAAYAALVVKGKWRGSKLLRHGVQYAALVGAWYVGLSRVVEHMHHWSDVAAGFLIGAAYAALVFIYVLKPKKYGPPGSWEQPVPQSTLPRPVLAR